jgi:hypothetical protein
MILISFEIFLDLLLFICIKVYPLSCYDWRKMEWYDVPIVVEDEVQVEKFEYSSRDPWLDFLTF